MPRGYGRALLSRDVRREQKELEEQATKRGMWGSIGSTLGTIAATAFLGPAAGVVATGIGTAAGSLFGGAAGSKFAGPIKEGTFFKSEREKIRTKTDPFGEERLTGAVSAGVTAGMGQALKISESVSAAKAAAPAGSTAQELTAIGEKARSQYGHGKFGFDFWGSRVGQKAAPMYRKSPGLRPGASLAFEPEMLQDLSIDEVTATRLKGAPIRPEVSMTAEEPSRVMGLPRGETSGLDPFEMPSDMAPPAMLRSPRQMPSRIDIQAGRQQFGQRFPAATRGLEQENLLYDEWRKGVEFEGPQYAPPGDMWTRRLPSLGG